MPNARVLVVDDEDQLRDLLVAVLQDAGYTADGVASGEEALARVGAARPDLIILDMLMPDVDGFEFLARLRAEPLHSAVPVLINSALGGTLARAIEPASADTLGIVGVLAKPVSIEVLLERVRAVIGPGCVRSLGE